jgi:hypothetical protein
MGSGGGGGSKDNTIKYSPYLEAAHGIILNHNGQDSPDNSVVSLMNAAWGNSPYDDGIQFDLDPQFFGIKDLESGEAYLLTDFPSLWDMFGKFMAGLDVHNLFLQTYNGLADSAEINASILAEADILDEVIESKTYPRFHAGMRNINAVQSSAFMTGRALIENARIIALNKYASEIRLKVFDTAAVMWSSHLNWNNEVVKSYAGMYKLYHATQLDSDAHVMDRAGKHSLYDLEITRYYRDMLSIISGADASETSVPKQLSQAQKSISGTVGGAASGAAIGAATGTASGGIVGAAIGAVLGFAFSYM